MSGGAAGYVLVSDANGNGTWQQLTTTSNLLKKTNDLPGALTNKLKEQQVLIEKLTQQIEFLTQRVSEQQQEQIKLKAKLDLVEHR